MWEWLASFLSGPIINGAINAYKAKLANDNDRDKMAADLAGREIALQQAEAAAQAQLRVAEVGHPWEVEKLFAYVTLVFYAKVLIWDAALHLGSTDAVKGAVAEWAGWIMLFYFGKRGVENVVRILKR